MRNFWKHRFHKLRISRFSVFQRCWRNSVCKNMRNRMHCLVPNSPSLSATLPKVGERELCSFRFKMVVKKKLFSGFFLVKWGCFRYSLVVQFFLLAVFVFLQMSVPEVVKRVRAEIEVVEEIPDLKLIRPKIFPDHRGFFIESYNFEEWSSQLGFSEIFKQVHVCQYFLFM